MEPQDFSCSITLPANAMQVIDAICNIPAWWAKNVQGGTQSLNSIFTVRFGETVGRFKITTLVPGCKIVWQTVDCYLPIFKNTTDWNGTEIHWNVSTVNGGTSIHFTHVGLVPGKECYNDCVGGWNFYIKESLYKLITEGQGMPGTGIRRTINSRNGTYKGILYFKNDTLPALPGNYILVDVKELQGEHVASAYAIEPLDVNTFDAMRLRGKHYMIVEDMPISNGISVLEDLQIAKLQRFNNILNKTK